MSAQTRPHSLSAAAALLQCDAARLKALVADAVWEAERPSASSCVMPEPARRVLIELDGRLLTAERAPGSGDAWHLLLPV